MHVWFANRMVFVLQQAADARVCLCLHPDHPALRHGSKISDDGNGADVAKRSRGAPGPPDFVFRCGACQAEWKMEKPRMPRGA